MKRRIQNLLRKVHHSIPPEIRKSYRFIIIIFQHIGKYLLPVHHYHCNERGSNEPFSLIYMGWDKKLCKYWLNRLSDNYEIRPGRKRITPWGIPKYLEKNSKTVDLAIIESNKKNRDDKYPNGFLLPRWMEMEVEYEVSLKRNRIKQIVRSIRKYSLDYEVKEGVEDFNLFYHSMYEPYVLRRHGELADLADYKHFYNKFLNEESVIFFIVRNGEPLAAAYIEIKESGYRLSAIGLMEGRENIFNMGVTGALYYFVMHHYQKQGIPSILIGNSRPLFYDGVTSFKILIGAKPYFKDLEHKQKHYFIPMNAGPALVSLLKSNPLFHIEAGKLNIASFVSGKDYESKGDFLEYFKRIGSVPVEKTTVYYFDDPEKIIQWIEEEEIAGIEFIKYEGIT